MLADAAGSRVLLGGLAQCSLPLHACLLAAGEVRQLLLLLLLRLLRQAHPLKGCEIGPDRVRRHNY